MGLRLIGGSVEVTKIVGTGGLGLEATVPGFGTSVLGLEPGTGLEERES